MSRSSKKTPVAPMVGPKSQKKAKQFAHRAERKRVHEAVHKEPLGDIVPFAPALAVMVKVLITKVALTVQFAVIGPVV